MGLFSGTNTSSSTGSSSSSQHGSTTTSSTSNEASSLRYEDFVKDTIVFTGMFLLSKMAMTYVLHQYQQSQSNYPSKKDALYRLQSIFSYNKNSESDSSNKNSIHNTTKHRPKLSEVRLDQYEAAIASDVIDPTQISTRFHHIGGIDKIKAELWDLVVLPLLRPDLFSSPSGLVSPPRGVLLYGAPGTGKTMLAKAIAGEGSAAFINVRLSSIMNKWFGESNKLVSATFSLAEKLAPSVIFIDELDTFLNQRDGSENSATSTMKSEFLTLWDGMLTKESSADEQIQNDSTIIVLGATNRPFDVDSAILRRLPRTFEIGLPPEKSRLQILNLILEKQAMTQSARTSIPKIAKVTVGYSGSDLKELCRAAAMEPIRELMQESSLLAVSRNPNSAREKKRSFNDENVGPGQGVKARPVEYHDFLAALKKVKRTGATAMEFQRREHQNRQNSGEGQGINGEDIAKGLQALQQMFSISNNTHSNIHNKEDFESDDDEIPNL